MAQRRLTEPSTPVRSSEGRVPLSASRIDDIRLPPSELISLQRQFQHARQLGMETPGLLKRPRSRTPQVPESPVKRGLAEDKKRQSFIVPVGDSIAFNPSYSGPVTLLFLKYFTKVEMKEKKRHPPVPANASPPSSESPKITKSLDVKPKSPAPVDDSLPDVDRRKSQPDRSISSSKSDTIRNGNSTGTFSYLDRILAAQREKKLALKKAPGTVEIEKIDLAQPEVELETLPKTHLEPNGEQYGTPLAALDGPDGSPVHYPIDTPDASSVPEDPIEDPAHDPIDFPIDSPREDPIEDLDIPLDDNPIEYPVDEPGAPIDDPEAVRDDLDAPIDLDIPLDDNMISEEHFQADSPSSASDLDDILDESPTPSEIPPILERVDKPESRKIGPTINKVPLKTVKDVIKTTLPLLPGTKGKKIRIGDEAMEEIHKQSDIFLESFISDLDAYAEHRGSNQIGIKDVALYLNRLKFPAADGILTNSAAYFSEFARDHLPLELLINLDNALKNENGVIDTDEESESSIASIKFPTKRRLSNFSDSD